MTCLNCHRVNRGDARFCDSCGTPLAAQPAAAEPTVARKVVTIVFADLIGSTALHERLDAESAHAVMDRYYQALHGAVTAHGGTVVKLLGDGVMAAFGVPRVAEDDAMRAVRAGLAMQRAFRAMVDADRAVVGALGLRVAVNTGEVVVSADQTDVVGDPVNVAARLQQEAQDGDVLLGESTHRLVADLVTLAPVGELTLRGRAESVAAYRLVSLERPVGAAATAFVGRDDELRRLLAVYDDAVRARRARLAVVLGSPGLGKSRLLSELRRRFGDAAAVLDARCDAARGATFAPLAEALRAHLRLDDAAAGDAVRAAIEAVLSGDDAERARVVAGIAALLAGAPAAPEETFFVVRRLLRGLAARRPVVLIVDDVQWAEPLLLDLAEHLVEWSGDAPLLVLLAARPELRESRPGLTRPGTVVRDVVTLAGLDAGAATRLAANVVGADELPAALAGRVLATSEGNPLFVGELVRMLVHDGVLRRDGDRWTTAVELAALEMPPTIHALLAARIERLRPEERAVLERAAVIGRSFSRAAVEALLPREAVDGLEECLDALRRSELIEPDPAWYLGEPALRFHHLLVRDAAYRQLLKGTRAELHGRVAEWIVARSGAAGEHDEMIGWHLEQAHQHLAELGPLDAAGRAIGARAARYLAAAGRRALARDDMPPAASLLGRALARLDADDGARADLALDWCEALLAAGDVGRAAAAIAELARFTSVSPRLRAWHTCFVGQLAVFIDPQALRATADAAAAAARVLADQGDAAGEAKAHAVHATALARLGAIGAGEAALDKALAAARRAGDRRRANAVLAGAPLAALWGPSPVTRASGRCLDVVRVLRITHGAPAVEAVALRCQAVLEALRGRTDAARRMIGSSRRLVEELGITHRLLEADLFAGLIELLDGDAGAAERCLRPAYEGLRTQGHGIDAARAAAFLGSALLAQGRLEEAEALSRESEALAGDDLQAAIAWRGVRAEALARRGEPTAAVEIARAAVDIAAATDALLDHADARLALSIALRAAGLPAEAAAEEARAAELWEAKGATVLSARMPRTSTPADAPAAGWPSPVARRVRANAATENAARVDAAVGARDLDALAAAIGEGRIVHHPTGRPYGRDEILTAFTTLFAASDLIHTHVVLATLGDSLALIRLTVSASETSIAALETGAGEFEALLLSEVDARGQLLRGELFASECLGEAVTQLYARCAEQLPDGPARTRGAAIARAVATFLGPLNLDDVAAVITPDLTFVDHRRAGFPAGRGAHAYLRGLHSLFDAANPMEPRPVDVLAQHPDALLVRCAASGIEPVGGGAFEVEFCQLLVFDAEGRVTRTELFDVDRDAETLARFDGVGTADRLESYAENTAVRTGRALRAALETLDWEQVGSLLAPGFHGADRRHTASLESGREDWLAAVRLMFTERAHSPLAVEPLATRGDRLALVRARWAASGASVGPSERTWLQLIEVDDAGRLVAEVSFDPDALDAAYDEIDARFIAGEGAPHAAFLTAFAAYRRASEARDWDTVARLLPDDFSLIDRRPLVGTEAPVGRDQYLATRGRLDDLGLQGALRLDHIPRLSHTAMLAVMAWYGTVAGGDFESEYLAVCRHDGVRMHAVELLGRGDFAAAEARFAALSTAATAPRIENAAMRSIERFQAAWKARDWAGVEAVFAPAYRHCDRRALVRLELDRDGMLASLRPAMEMDTTIPLQLGEALATRGDRLALVRGGFQTGHGDVAPRALEWLMVVEVDERGDRIAGVNFDADDLDAAIAELDARYATGEAKPFARIRAAMLEFRRAFAARDWPALTAILSPDLEMHDHRPLGWEPSHGPEPYIAALQSLVDLSPDVQLRLDHGEMCAHGYLSLVTWAGTHEGGVFEAPSYIVGEMDAQMRARRFDQYDLDQLDEALARFAALRADSCNSSPQGSRGAL